MRVDGVLSSNAPKLLPCRPFLISSKDLVVGAFLRSPSRLRAGERTCVAKLFQGHRCDEPNFQSKHEPSVLACITYHIPRIRTRLSETQANANRGQL